MKTRLFLPGQAAHIAVMAVCAMLLASPAAQAKCMKPDTCAESARLFRRSRSDRRFQRDRYQDLAISVPYENIGSIVDAGAMEVIYGTASGLASPNRRVVNAVRSAPTWDKTLLLIT